jgi:hypothetical protein
VAAASTTAPKPKALDRTRPATDRLSLATPTGPSPRTPAHYSALHAIGPCQSVDPGLARAAGRRPHPKCGLRRTPTVNCGASPRLPCRAGSSGAVRCSVTSLRGEIRRSDRRVNGRILSPACRGNPGCGSKPSHNEDPLTTRRMSGAPSP